ncbi:MULTISPECIES: flavin monoamine oxidase family protein [unclassified Microbacterium]|uniref:flavin monoamine oxidase family protein n=1 Tax=unclassified Microbacterium TaxID=2609290 RepID=UPI0030198575
MSKSLESRTSVDVVVVGAGFSGLSAAERLVELGLSVVVLEGRDRVGGRVRTGEVAGVPVDFGGTWVSPRHTAIRDLAQRYGCSITPQFADGRNTLWMGGRRRTYKGTIPPVSPLTVVNMARVQMAIEKLVATIDPEAGWRSPNAAELDAISFGQWLGQQRAGAATRALMNMVSRVQWGASPDDLSMLSILRYIRGAGGFDHMLDVENGMQQDRITETTQEIAKRVAAHLGDRVQLSSPVRRIAQDGTGVTVDTDAESITARYAIVTTATMHRKDIAFEPALSERAVSLSKLWRLGGLSKAFVAYETPFWRKEGVSGEGVSDTGAVFATFDVGPDDGPGVLLGFCDAVLFDGFDQETRRKRVIEQMVALYGPQAQNPIDYVDHRWLEEDFAPGGPNPALAPLALTSYATELTEPHGRVEWAGTETAAESSGCMNGAVVTGQQAAERVARRIADDSVRSDPRASARVGQTIGKD